MESKVKVAGHAVHPMLVAFPLGLLTTAVIFDMMLPRLREPRYGRWSRTT